MAPLADNEHQCLGLEFGDRPAERSVDRPTAQIFAGCNVSDREAMDEELPMPDVAVFLPGNPAQDRGTHWFGGPDFAVEIISRYDRSREKFGVLCQGRCPRAAPGRSQALAPGALPRIEDDWVARRQIGPRDRPASPLRSEVLPVSFRLLARRPRPRSR